MTPKYIAHALTERQRSTLAWLIEDWVYPYRGSPEEDVRGLVRLRLLEPPTEDAWGDATLLGHEVWKHARPQWVEEHKLGARFGVRVRSGVLQPFKRSGMGNVESVSQLDRLYRKYVGRGALDVERLYEELRRETRAAEQGRTRVSRDLLRELRADRAFVGRILNASRH